MDTQTRLPVQTQAAEEMNASTRIPQDASLEEMPTNAIATRSSAQGSNADQTPSQMAKNAPAELKIHKLPSVEDIYKAIPAAGINIRALVSKFKQQVDETNAQLFFHIIQAISTIDVTVWVKPRSQLPSAGVIENIIKKAKHRHELQAKYETKEYKVTSKLVGPMEITFSEVPEVVRDASNMRPAALYRVFYETSATLSCYVSKDTHSKYRHNRGLKLQEGNAFQSIGMFDAARDFTKQRIERHLSWAKKKDPSSYISAFNHLYYAKKRAIYHYHISQRIGERTCVAQISTEGLIAATVRGTLRTTVETFSKFSFGFPDSRTSTERDVKIPCWIRDTAVPQDGSSITIDQLTDSGADIWMSITELRRSDLKVGSGSGRTTHDYEWLACGVIPEEHVKCVMPFDGDTLHEAEGPEIVSSKRSSQPWIFDWSKKMWRLEESQLAQLATGTHENSIVSKKRKPDEGIHEDQQHKQKKRQIDIHDARSSEVDSAEGCCLGILWRRQLSILSEALPT